MYDQEEPAVVVTLPEAAKPDVTHISVSSGMGGKELEWCCLL